MKITPAVLPALGLLAAALQPHLASAHKPSYANDHSTFETAFEVIDPEISIVLYSEMTCSEEQVWLHMDTTDLDQVWLELGVPVIDRLAEYRPSLAIVAEGLPAVDLPFDLPPGMGATVIDTEDVTDPILFSEEFTQTDSWILFRDWFDVPSAQDVYLVAFNPAEYTGKLWVAVGLVEDFSDVDMSVFPEWLEKTRAFHEIGDTELHTELDCSQVYDESDARDSGATPDGGCSMTRVDHGSYGILALIGLLAAARRRQA